MGQLGREGFFVPRPEILLILKQAAFHDRVGTPKGEKDKIDIISLLNNDLINFKLYKKFLKQYERTDLLNNLKEIISGIIEVNELNLNRHSLSHLKKSVLSKI